MKAPRLSAAATAMAATAMVLSPMPFPQRSGTPDQTPTPRHRDSAIFAGNFTPQQRENPQTPSQPIATSERPDQLGENRGFGPKLNRSTSRGVSPNFDDPQISNFQSFHRNGALRAANIGPEIEEPTSSDTTQSIESIETTEDSVSLIDKITARVLRNIRTRIKKYHDGKSQGLLIAQLTQEETDKHLRRGVGQLPSDEWTFEQLNLADANGLDWLRESIAYAVSSAIKVANSKNRAEKRSYRLMDQIRSRAQKRDQRNFIQEQPEAAPFSLSTNLIL